MSLPNLITRSSSVSAIWEPTSLGGRRPQTNNTFQSRIIGVNALQLVKLGFQTCDSEPSLYTVETYLERIGCGKHSTSFHVSRALPPSSVHPFAWVTTNHWQPYTAATGTMIRALQRLAESRLHCRLSMAAMSRLCVGNRVMRAGECSLPQWTLA